MQKNKQKGFTFSETLITIVVIGIVAALTIPFIQVNYDWHIRRAKVMNFMKIMNNAMEDALVDNEESPLIDISQCRDLRKMNLGVSCGSDVTISLVNRLKDYLPIAKDCGYGSGCAFPGNYVFLHGGTENNALYLSTMFNYDDGYYKFDLEDGSHVYIWRRIDNGLLDPDLKSASYTRTTLYYDMNGDKGPNRFGKDFFRFTLFPFQGRMVPYDAKLDVPISVNDCKNGGDGTTCSVNVVLNRKY